LLDRGALANDRFARRTVRHPLYRGRPLTSCSSISGRTCATRRA
jgi:hypothetical protein